MAETAIGPRFSVGKVLVGSFDLLFKNLVAIIMLAAIILVPGLALGGILIFAVIGGTAGAGGGQAFGILGGVVGVFLFVLLYQLITAAVIHTVFRSMRGQRASLSASLSLGFSRVGSLILVAILYGLGVMAGSIVFIIPGIIVFVIWYLAVPACVIERRDAIESLTRSQELTRGHRWAIFGLLLVIVIGSAIGNVLIETVVGLVAGETGALGASAAWSLLTSAYSAVALAVVYHDLRVEKEGVDVEQIAELFA